MNKKIDLSSLKGNDSIIVAILMVLLMIILCVAGWFTFQKTIVLKEELDTSVNAYSERISLLTSLRALRDNSEYYEAQKAKYDEVIKDNGTYSVIGYTLDIDDLCREYDLTIQELDVGGMATEGTVNAARTKITLVGKESNVKKFCAYVVSQKEIARIDDFTMVTNGDDTVTASMTIVNFTK